MSQAERQELSSLVVWLKTFPQMKQFCSNNSGTTNEKENEEESDIRALLDDPSFGSCIYDVAVEICNVGDGDDSTLAQSGDVWDNIFAMTRKVQNRKSLDPCPTDTPHCWEGFQQHAALAYLLDGTVGTKDIELRRVYIERIMGMSDIHQRTLMSLIERRKKKGGKTPSKKDRSSRKKSKLNKDTHNNLETPPPTSSRKELRSTPATKKSDTRSPFVPRDPNVSIFAASAGQPDSNQNNDTETPNNLVQRRSFDEAFGSTEQYFRAMSPSPKRNIQPREMFTPGLGDSAEYEKQIQELKEKNQQLAHALEKSRDKEDDMTKQLEDIESNYRKEMIKVEALSRHREDESKEQYETRLAALRVELDMLGEKYEQAQRAREELEGVKDEMDVMMHTKSMLADATERLRTYKEKVQQLGDVKEALQKEEEAHSRSVEECLRLENDLKALQPLKRQLEEYKTRAVDAEVRFTECQDELVKIKKMGLASNDTNHDLEALVQSKSEEIEELNQRLHHEERGTLAAVGLGEGMSELNPELKEEVYRLRNENEQLKAFASKREDDAVTKMEQDLEDANMLTERFKKQFLSTKEDLETTQQDLKETQTREKNLQNELLFTQKLLSETQDSEAMLQSDLSDTKDALLETQNREASLQRDLSDTKKLLDETEERKVQLESDLSDTQKILSETEERKAKLGSDLSDTQKLLLETEEREQKLQNELSNTKNYLSDSMSEAERFSQELKQCTEVLDASKLRETQLNEDLSVSTNRANDLQSQCDDLTGRLGVCSNDLMVSIAREADLKQEVEGWKHKFTQAEERGDDLDARLRESCAQVNTLKEQVHVLEGEVTSWKQQLQVSQESSENLMEQLKTSKADLHTMRETQKNLNIQLFDVSKEAKDSNEKNQQLEKQVITCIEELKECTQILKQSEETNAALRGDLTDMTSRAEDAEAVSKQRMELVQSTREKLKAARAENTELTEEREKRLEALQSVNEKHTTLKIHADKVQRELADARDILEQTEDSLKDSKRQVASLEKKTEKLEADCEDWKGKSLYESRLNQQLREKLVENRDLLSKAQNSIKIYKDNEIVLKEELDHAEQMMFELEDTVEEKTTAANNLEKDLEATQQEKAKIIKDLEAHKEKLGKKLEEEIVQSNKYKQELFSAQETLNETQSSLGASQHREKKLKLEVSKLQDEKSDLRNELEAEKAKTQEAIVESAKSMENSCDALSAKAQQEYEELQYNMNQLLEGERKAKKRDEEKYKAKMQEMRIKFESDLSLQKIKSEEEAKAAAEESKVQIDSLRREIEVKMESIRSKAALDKEKLMLKGKGMLNEARNKAKEELDQVKAEYASLQEKYETERKQKEHIAQQYTTKVSEYKKKLQNSSSRISSLSADEGELQEKVTALQREKMKLLEENDRYRRQLGGRFGSDSKHQNQIDKLQKELGSAMDEIHVLRQNQRSSNSGGVSPSVLPAIDENGEGDLDQSYSRDAVNQSTLVQMRGEYEEQIQQLNDDKRDLVMKNTAAFTDVQKAEKRAWQSEQQNSDLQQELTSLKLQVERLQNLQQESVEQNHSVIIGSSLKPSSNKRGEGSGVPQRVSTRKEDNSSYGGGGLASMSLASLEESSDIVSLSVREEASAADTSMDNANKSFVDLYPKSPPKNEAPADCKQS